MGSLRMLVIFVALFWSIFCSTMYKLSHAPDYLVIAIMGFGIALFFILVELYHTWRDRNVH